MQNNSFDLNKMNFEIFNPENREKTSKRLKGGDNFVEMNSHKRLVVSSGGSGELDTSSLCGCVAISVIGLLEDGSAEIALGHFDPMSVKLEREIKTRESAKNSFHRTNIDMVTTSGLYPNGKKALKAIFVSFSPDSFGGDESANEVEEISQQSDIPHKRLKYSPVGNNTFAIGIEGG